MGCCRRGRAGPHGGFQSRQAGPLPPHTQHRRMRRSSAAAELSSSNCRTSSSKLQQQRLSVLSGRAWGLTSLEAMAGAWPSLAWRGLAAGALLAAACLGLVWCRSFMTLVLPPFHSWHGLFLAYVHSSPGSGLSCNEVAWLQCFFLGRLGSANKHARQTPDAACLA